MENKYIKKIMSVAILVILLVLSFFILKPILLSIILGCLLAFIFTPIYKALFKLTKSPNFSATLICIFLILIIVLPLWFFTPTIIDQAFKIYLSAQQIDFVTPIQNIFPALFDSEQFSIEVGTMIHSFVTKTLNSLVNGLAQIILNFPTLLLQFLVVLFSFYFVLRDRIALIGYLKTLLPFSKEIEEKIFKASKEITSSVLYGQLILGVIQGIVIAIGFFIFGVPHALLFSLIATIAGILPIIGTMMVWLPMMIYLFVMGNTFAAVGILLFGLVSSNIDNLLRPFLVSKMTKLHSGIVLIGMIGGIFFFGILGLILGPLILAYLLILLEIYKDKGSSGIFIHKETKKK